MATPIKRGPGLRGFPGFAAGTNNTNPVTAADSPAPAAAIATPSGPTGYAAPLANAIDSFMSAARAANPYAGLDTGGAPPPVAPAAPTPLDNAIGGPAPAAAPAVNTSYGPQMDPNAVPPSLAHAISADAPPGRRIDTHTLGETNPGIHNVEDFVRANSHLTPLDIQILQQGKMSPHDQMLKDVLNTHASMRQVALDAASAMPEGTAKTKALTKAYADDLARKEKLLIPTLGSAYAPSVMQAEQDARRGAKRGLVE